MIYEANLVYLHLINYLNISSVINKNTLFHFLSEITTAIILHTEEAVFADFTCIAQILSLSDHWMWLKFDILNPYIHSSTICTLYTVEPS